MTHPSSVARACKSNAQLQADQCDDHIMRCLAGAKKREQRWGSISHCCCDMAARFMADMQVMLVASFSTTDTIGGKEPGMDGNNLHA